MFTPDPNTAHVIAAAKEKLQSQLVYLENALMDKTYGVRTTGIYGFVFYLVGTELHYSGDPDGYLPVDADCEVPAHELLNCTGFDSVFRNDLSQAIMNWFANPTYQE